MQFRVISKASGSNARLGQLVTARANLETPIFMPVGTHGAVRGQPFDQIQALEYQLLLANTYHLLVRPGLEFLKKEEGLNRFSKWSGGFLTDSGGFQIFSLPHARKITDEGAVFRSYLDGSLIKLTPESCIDAQKIIGSDIMMVLDECVPSTSSKEIVLDSIRRTHLWASRSLNIERSPSQALFAIVQGACYPELRKESAEFLTQLPFDGFAIGGLAVGEGKSLREEMTGITSQYLPNDKPRYLMGVGTPLDILESVHHGMDMFDCILPTNLGAQGVVFTSEGRLDLRRGRYKDDSTPIDPNCSCQTCTQYDRKYLHHLIKVYEPLAGSALGFHNLYFYQKLMSQIRDAIRDDTFSSFYKAKRIELAKMDGDGITSTPPRKKNLSLGNYTVHLHQGSNAYCIKHKEYHEVMHSSVDPIVESRKLYIDQSKLEELLHKKEEVVIWDVGLGAATNAMAAIKCAQELSETRGKLHLVSFEFDLDPLKLALKHCHWFPHLWHKAPTILKEEGYWAQDDIEWTLLHGDFSEKMVSAPKPDLIFYDPFSYKGEPEMWSFDLFSKMYNLLKDTETKLFTYSASTMVRVALLCAGFFVGRGQATGQKVETTYALTKPSADFFSELLPQEWLLKWERSHAKLPVGMNDDDLPKIRSLLYSHRQFINPQPKGLSYEQKSPEL